MKVLQINKYFYPKGGSETVFFNTVDLLMEHGNDVHCIALNDPTNYPSKDSRYFVDYPELVNLCFFGKLKHSLSFFYNREARKKIEQLILEQKPDVAHIHLLFNGLSVSILPVLKKYHIPIVMTAHDYRFICPAYLFLNGKDQICERCHNGNFLQCIKHNCSRKGRLVSAMLCLDMYFRNLFYPISKYVSKFIFVSDFELEKHTSFNPIYKERGVRLYNLVKQNKPIDAENKQVGERYYLYYGRLSREKGILTLLDAVKKLHVKLKIVGKGDVLDDCLTALPQNIELLGFKSGKELEELIKNAYFVIVPSEWYETFGLTAVEPQVWGIPVIGARIGAIPELIQDGENGYLFDSGNITELRQVIEKANACSLDKYKEMSVKARNFATQFTDSEAYCQTLIDIYEKAKIRYSRDTRYS
jgi:glycosyltransferase involved in cell wall biosynthesis